MPSRIRKLQKNRKLTLRKNKKLKKRLTKMRGGAAAAAAPYGDCYTPGDSLLIPIGVPDITYLSAEPYDSSMTMYSDHAPIIYDFDLVKGPLKNPNVKIITWNVGQWGNRYFPTPSGIFAYNHKFTMDREEEEWEYRKRMQNIVRAMKTLLLKKTRGGKNDPFLFCQELPVIFEKDAIATNLRKKFKELLADAGLSLISDSDDSDDRVPPDSVESVSEFGLIGLRNNNDSQKFTVLKKEEYRGNLIFPNSPPSRKYPNGLPDPDLRRFEIYYYDFTYKGTTTTFYYVNVHALHTDAPDAPAIIVKFFNRIIDTIQVYHASKHDTIDNVSIYIVGDYNFNIASPAINDLILFDENYKYNIVNLFANPKLNRKITSMYKLTTVEAKGFSLIDNSGTRSPCNIDCILKLDLASM
jgi:hypothetical protein